MASIPVSRSKISPAELNLLLDWPERRSFGSWAFIAGIATIVQAIFFVGLLQLASIRTPESPTRTAVIHRIRLYLPPDLLTQKAPNRTKPTENIDLANLLAAQQAQPQRPNPAPSVRHFEVPQTAIQKPKSQPEPRAQTPNLAVNEGPAQLPAGAVNGLPLPDVPPPASTNQPFQDIGSDEPVHNPHPSLHVPKPSVDGAIQSLAQTPNARRMIVTDSSDSRPTPGIAGSGAQMGVEHMEVELKSDTDVPDFRAYLTRILSIVRANWRRVTPESVHFGTLRGANVVELVINRDGSIPKLVIGEPSNIDALDRASVAGVSMSNPLPPLPADFKGQQVRLAFTFKYNMPQ